MTFTTRDLPDVRRFAASWATRAGMSADSLTDFVIAVNEIATNAVRHGSPRAWLRLWTSAGALIAEIRDTGRWSPGALKARAQNRAEETGGMGLQVARKVCDDLRVTSGADGTIVLLRMALR